jgi:hypothetical protein
MSESGLSAVILTLSGPADQGVFVRLREIML